jgi:hypothetical protein
MINFDDLSSGVTIDGSAASDSYFGGKVVFSNSNGHLTAHEAFPGDPFSPPISILPTFYYVSGNKSRAQFSVGGVNYVSIVMGDFDDDEDSIYLQAYGHADNLLVEDADTVPEWLYGGRTLSVSAPDISYVDFWGTGLNNNSVYFDNFEYGVVPEPASFLLFGIGGLAMGLLKRRKRI